MHITGAYPKRDEDRIRRNAPEYPVENLILEDEVEIPELNMPQAHELVIDFYESLKISGQAKYYEPSDWQVARLLCYILNDFLNSSRLSAQMLTAMHSIMADLMTTEGSRRRLRLEIQRNKKKNDQDDPSAAIIKQYQEMMNG